MTNYEKYKDLIHKIGRNIGISKKTNIPERCDVISCYDCLRYITGGCNDSILAKWCATEYIAPLIDWTKVEVDTPVLVSNDNKKWYKRYFAGSVNGIVRTWRLGTTSWSDDGDNDTMTWEYAKLAEKE